MLLLSAASVAAGIFLILELDGPFDGIVRLPSTPLRYAAAHIAQ